MEEGRRATRRYVLPIPRRKLGIRGNTTGGDPGARPSNRSLLRRFGAYLPAIGGTGNPSDIRFLS
jgi:hypothetical protein